HFAQEVHGAELHAAALHGFHQHGGGLVAALLDDLQAFGRAVVQHQHVLHGLGHDAGRAGIALLALAAADDHFVVDAVVAAAEADDEAAARHRAGHAHGAQHRLGAGVAHGGARSEEHTSELQS